MAEAAHTTAAAAPGRRIGYAATMASASWSRRAVLGIALAGALVAWLYPTDEKRVKAAAEAIVAGANEGPRALSLALEEHALPSVRLSVSELAEPLEGKSALVEALAA